MYRAEVRDVGEGLRLGLFLIGAFGFLEAKGGLLLGGA